MNKRCCNCKSVKDISNFSFDKSRKDGYRPWCKACVRQYRDSHVEDFAKNNKKYSMTEKGKKIIGKNAKIQRRKYPEKAKARDMVNHSITLGKIQPANSYKCSVCNTSQAREYHHVNGYKVENWLDVIPVCRSCHRVIDKVN